MRNCALVATGALALAACERAPAPPDEAPAPTPAAPTTSATAPVSIIRDDIEVEREAPPLAPLEARIGFPEGGSDLTEAAQARLATVLESPQIAAGGRIVLRGHTDSAGSDAANLRAARQRAEAVRDWLVENGVDAKRIAIVALGEQNPIEPNAMPDGEPNERGRAANRRVDIAVAVPDGTPEVRATGHSETLVDGLTRPAD